MPKRVMTTMATEAARYEAKKRMMTTMTTKAVRYEAKEGDDNDDN